MSIMPFEEQYESAKKMIKDAVDHHMIARLLKLNITTVQLIAKGDSIESIKLKSRYNS